MTRAIQILRDPKDSVVSWINRFQRITGRTPSFAEIKKTNFPYWVSNNAAYYTTADRAEIAKNLRSWFEVNLQVENFVILADGASTESNLWPSTSFQSLRPPLVVFTNDADAVIFKLSHNESNQQ